MAKNNFFLSSENKEEIIRTFKRCFSNRVGKIIKEADDILNHNFDLLGSGKVNLGERINWHCDFKSGFCWDPGTFHSNIKFGDKEGVDVKVPWELSRFQHLAALGKAYWLTKEEKYTKEFIDEVKDWIENNPAEYGINWRCPMDVAIRASNWILGFHFFKDSKEISDEFLTKFLDNLLIHGKFLKRNLERSWRGLTSNHYLSDIVGLLYLGIFFSERKIGKRWQKFGISELKKEIKKQIYPDGCDFEASTCYHRLALELFFFATLLTVINDKDFNGENYQEIAEKIFGKEYTKKLYMMFEAVYYLLKPNGKMPQIGDNDSGRQHIFVKRDVLDMRYLLTFGAVFFKERKFKIKEFGFSEDALWIFGEKGYNFWQGLKENSILNIKSRAFSDSGWYVMRDRMNYMIISAGPNGQKGGGGHCHNDKLSFELSAEGKDLIVDPGTFVYTPFPAWRNKFRSTAYHNTVVIDGTEQNRFIKNNLFSLKNDAKVKINRWKVADEFDVLDAEYSSHRREIVFYKKEKKWVIKDVLTGKGSFDLYFHLAHPNFVKQNLGGLAPMKIERNGLLVQTKNPEGANLRIRPLRTEGLSLSLEKAWISSEYGRKIQSLVLRYSKENSPKTQLLTEISLL